MQALAIRRIDAVPIVIKHTRSDATDLLLFTDSELDKAPRRLSPRTPLLVAIPYRGDEHLVASVRRPVEVASLPRVTKATAQIRSIPVDGETRGLPVRSLMRDLVEPIDRARKEEYLLSVLRDYGMAIVCKRMSGLARMYLGLRHQ